MQVPPQESIFWPMAKQAVMGVTMTAFVMFAYKNKMAPQDIVMIITTMAGVFGVQVAQRTIAPSDAKSDR